MKERISKINFGDQFKPEYLRKLIKDSLHAIIASEYDINQIRKYYYYYQFHQSSERIEFDLGGFPIGETLNTELKYKIKNL